MSSTTVFDRGTVLTSSDGADGVVVYDRRNDGAWVKTDVGA